MVGTATKPSFIVDDTNVELQDDDFIGKETEDSESDKHYDSVCAICDNGGGLLWYYLLPHVVISLNNPLGRLKLVYSWICELVLAIRRVAFSVTL